MHWKHTRSIDFTIRSNVWCLRYSFHAPSKKNAENVHSSAAASHPLPWQAHTWRSTQVSGCKSTLYSIPDLCPSRKEGYSHTAWTHWNWRPPSTFLRMLGWGSGLTSGNHAAVGPGCLLCAGEWTSVKDNNSTENSRHLFFDSQNNL